nr:hypothetical protein Itr_chr09CG16080 [Ipomoea trifida]
MSNSIFFCASISSTMLADDSIFLSFFFPNISGRNHRGEGTSCCLNGKNFAELVDAGFGLRSGHDGLVVVADELVPARA